jgi:cytochrome c-type biogenesis protein CcmH
MVLALALAMALQTAQAPAPQPYDSALEARTKEVASVLRCPVCQGLSIQDSPSELSLQMKAVVRQQLREGKSPQEVKAYFVSKYGEWILLEPKASGANLLVYLLPIALVLGGGVFIWVMVRKWSASGSAAEASQQEEELPV